MRTVDRVVIRAPMSDAFHAASDVERWPDLLPHYRWVRFLERRPGGGLVEMSANRPFGPLDWPTWWVSEMWIEPARGAVRYRHVRGITTGMDVEWTLRDAADGVDVSIVHEWSGPSWPLIRQPAAEWVIGPVFVHGIASRTLAGLKRALEGGEAAAKGMT
jgi:ribosome-associated toxin RatA of RatAB toxin-antitoxin module